MSQRRRRFRILSRTALRVAIAVAVVAGLLVADRAGLFGRAPRGDRDRYHGRTFTVLRVVDGDTLDIDVSDDSTGQRHTRVRLWGIDTPEIAHRNSSADHFGPEAATFARQLCRGQTVRIELEPVRDPRGKFGRLLAYVVLADGRMLNRVLLDEGFAYADRRFDHQHAKQFRDAEAVAMSAGTGLWKTVRRSDLPGHWGGRFRPPRMPATRPSAATRPSPG